MTYNVHDLHPTAQALPGEAQQIEVVRGRLIRRSEEVRVGSDIHPNWTAMRLARTALSLANSKAPMFEKLHTLNATHANLRARGVNSWNMRTVAGLSQRALEDAYPMTTDPATNELNQIEVLARRRAIEYTTPDTPFIVALDEAWDHLGYPIDPLIRRTEEKILASIQANARAKRAMAETGAIVEYDTLSDTEEELIDNRLSLPWRIK